MTSNPTGVTGAFAARNFSWLAAGNLVFGVTQWGVLVILAQLGGAGEVGELALALAIVTPTFMFASLKLRDVLATDVGEERPLGDYLVVTLINVGWAVPASLLIAGLLTASWSTVLIVAGMAAARGLEAVSHIFYGLAQRHDDMAPVGQSMVARGVLGLVLLGLGYAVTREVFWGAAGVAAAYALVLALHDVPRILARHRVNPWRRSGRVSALRSLGRAGLPLGVFALLESLLDNVPRLMLETMDGRAALGVFAAFGYVIVGGSTITRAIGQAAAPRVAASYVARDADRFKSQLVKVAGAGAALGVIGVLLALAIGEPFLDLAFGSEFADEWPAFVLVTLYGAFLFVAWPLTVAVIASRRFTQQLLIQSGSVATVIVVGAVSIDAFGIVGAAFSLLAGGAMRLALTAILLLRITRSLREESPLGAVDELSP